MAGLTIPTTEATIAQATAQLALIMDNALELELTGAINPA